VYRPTYVNILYVKSGEMGFEPIDSKNYTNV
jgi:hypothetical protein